MRIHKLAAVVACVVLVPACAALIGTVDQSITVALSPPDAVCLVMKDDEAIASLSRHARTITTSRSGRALLIDCHAPGHDAKIVRVDSTAPRWGMATIDCLLRDLCLTGTRSGPLNSYPETVSITLDKSHPRTQADRR
jgi:hypothetical protein